jgi:hypothetical protein
MLPRLLFDSDEKGWRKRTNVLGGGRNQQNGTECFDGGGVVDAEMRDE